MCFFFFSPASALLFFTVEYFGRGSFVFLRTFFFSAELLSFVCCCSFYYSSCLGFLFALSTLFMYVIAGFRRRANGLCFDIFLAHPRLCYFICLSFSSCFFVSPSLLFYCSCLILAFSVARHFCFGAFLFTPATIATILLFLFPVGCFLPRGFLFFSFAPLLFYCFCLLLFLICFVFPGYDTSVVCLQLVFSVAGFRPLPYYCFLFAIGFCS